MIGRTVFESPIAITEGKIPIEQQKAYGLENGIFIPKSWEILYGGTKIVVKGQSDTNEDKALTIDYMNACNYKALLDVVYDGVYRQRDSKLSAAWLKHWETNFPMEKPFTRHLAAVPYSIQTRVLILTAYWWISKVNCLPCQAIIM